LRRGVGHHWWLSSGRSARLRRGLLVGTCPRSLQLDHCGSRFPALPGRGPRQCIAVPPGGHRSRPCWRFFLAVLWPPPVTDCGCRPFMVSRPLHAACPPPVPVGAVLLPCATGRAASPGVLALSGVAVVLRPDAASKGPRHQTWRHPRLAAVAPRRGGDRCQSPPCARGGDHASPPLAAAFLLPSPPPAMGRPCALVAPVPGWGRCSPPRRRRP